jgi:hypothetical protein
MPEASQETVAQTISRNLTHLLSTYGRELGIAEGTGKRIRYYEKQDIELSAQTIRGFIQGNGSEAPQDATLDKLVKIFKKVLPGIQGNWLLARDPKELDDLLATAVSRDAITIAVPDYRKRILSLAKWMEGTYIAYRYAFEGLNDKEVAREVVHIWIDSDGVLWFRMSFWSRGAEAGQEAMEFTGHVIPIGHSIVFMGFSTGQAQHDRGRSLFLHDDRAHPRLRDCALGLLSSTRLHGDWSPCVACTLLVRVAGKPRDLKAFVQNATRIDDTGAMIRDDFGSRHELWIKAFLDNRPRGTIKEREYATVDGTPANRDPVLRLDRVRFGERMPHILADIMTDRKISAPFKPDWMKSSESGALVAFVGAESVVARGSGAGDPKQKSIGQPTAGARRRQNNRPNTD